MSLVDTTFRGTDVVRSAGAAPSRSATFAGRFILVIDDDPHLLNVVGGVLEDEGAQVSRANDGLEGLRTFAAEPPDLVVTDILMPNREGIETIVEMKRRHPGVKIVAMSGGARLGAENVLDLARQLGADATLSKPFASARLIETVAVLLA